MRHGRAGLSVRMLGAMGPEAQNAVEAHLATLNALEEQVVNDLVLVGRQGANVGDITTSLDLASEQIRVLDAETLTLQDDDVADWHTRADRVEAALRSMLDKLGAKREGLQERQRFMGLWWGLGVSAGVATLAWYVWRKRRRPRRRRS